MYIADRLGAGDIVLLNFSIHPLVQGPGALRYLFAFLSSPSLLLNWAYKGNTSASSRSAVREQPAETLVVEWKGNCQEYESGEHKNRRPPDRSGARALGRMSGFSWIGLGWVGWCWFGLDWIWLDWSGLDLIVWVCVGLVWFGV